MTLRKRVFLLTAASFAVAIGFGAYYQVKLYRDLLRKEEEGFCQRSVDEFWELVDHHRKTARSLSNYIAKDPEVVRLFDREDRQALYRRLKPLYEEFSREKLIREMTLFKLPANLFLNVRNPEAKARDSSRTRPDVVEAGKSCVTTDAILICINYVGIRAASPIMKGRRALGVVSVGIDMKDFLKHYTDITGIKGGLAVRDDVLRSSLLKKSYERYVKDNVKRGGYIVTLQKGSITAEKLEFTDKGVLPTGEDILVCSEPIKDFSGRTIGFFFTYTDTKALSSSLAVEGLKSLIAGYLFIFSALFLLVLTALGRISKRVEELLRLTELVKERKFSELRSYRISGSGDEFSLIEESIREMATEIERHINTLTKEVEVYTNKAYIDSLTKVFNRRAFEEFGVELIERFIAMGRKISVLMIDIDNFKEINDTYGHPVGDKVLEEVGTLIRDALRETDIVFRYGGEEFIAILPNTALEGALRAGENVRRRLESHTFRIDGREIRLTVSVGVAQVQEGDRSAKDVIERADKALYIAKKTGKNRVSAET